jgi:hypothetical protein
LGSGDLFVGIEGFVAHLKHQFHANFGFVDCNGGLMKVFDASRLRFWISVNQLLKEI